MTAVQKLQQRLASLPEEKREALAAALLKEWDAQAWDQQLEKDINAGKLNFLQSEVDTDLDAGRIRPV
jgi:uncharacterized protein YllA (UPF0747 family)